MSFRETLRPTKLATVVVVLLLVVSLVGCADWSPGQPPAETATTLLIVRHAEKAAEPADDPPLTDAGRRRADALAHLAASSGVSAAYATQYLRTQQTVKPLATQLGLTVRQRDADDVDGLVQQIFAENQGQTVVVAGHSGTVPLLVEKLTGSAAPPIEETEYDNLYVVTAWGPGKGKALRLRYGDSSTGEGAPATK
jgi:broad specificity phosphatase PhoE